MLDKFDSKHTTDAKGNPAGGWATGVGIEIEWQNGPLREDGPRKTPNGAFVETVIAIAVDRLKFYQTAADGKFACDENARAIAHLALALVELESRTRKREARGVEGTHTP